MCAGAAFWTRIGRVVYGARDHKRGGLDFHRKRDEGLLHPKTELVGACWRTVCGTPFVLLRGPPEKGGAPPICDVEDITRDFLNALEEISGRQDDRLKARIANSTRPTWPRSSIAFRTKKSIPLETHRRRGAR